VHVTLPFSPDSNFHAFEFVVDSPGNAAWYRDGISRLIHTGFSSNYLILKLSGGLSVGADPSLVTGYIDSVKVMSP